MLGLDHVVDARAPLRGPAGQLRDGRLHVRRDLVDLLLVATEAHRAGAARCRATAARVGADRGRRRSRRRAGRHRPGEVPRLLAGPAPSPADVEPRGPTDVADAGDPAAPGRTAPASRSGCRPVGSTTCSTSSARPSSTCAGSTGAATTVGELCRRAAAARPRGCGTCCCRPDAGLDSRPSPTPSTALVALGDRLHGGHPRAARAQRGRRRPAGPGPRRRHGPGDGPGAPGRRRLSRSSSARWPRRPARTCGSVLDGEDVELDARVLDGVADALRHLVTNAVDHGCESPGRAAGGRQAARGHGARRGPRRPARRSSSRSPTTAPGSTRTRCARRRSRAGCSPPTRQRPGSALPACCSMPGFTTRDDRHGDVGARVSAWTSSAPPSKDLGGTVEVVSEPAPAPVRAHPAGDARRHALPARPLRRRAVRRAACTGVVETVALADSQVHDVAGASVLVRHGEHGAARRPGRGPRCVAASAIPRVAVVVPAPPGETVAWAVDSLEGEREVVVKAARRSSSAGCPGVAGATIDSDGTLLLLVDLRELARPLAHAAAHVRRGGRSPPAAPRRARPSPRARTTGRRPGSRPAGAAGRRRCWWSRTRSACASCSA